MVIVELLFYCTILWALKSTQSFVKASKDIEIRPIGAIDTTSPEENADDDNNEIQIGIKNKWFVVYKFIPC